MFHKLVSSTDFTELCFCSRILVLDQGNIAEFDSPKALLTKKGIFYSMAKDAGLAD